MILTTLEQADFDALLDIQKKYPNLTFMHEPYQEWIPSHFTDEDKNALSDVKVILKKAITGFVKFTNFYYSESGILCIRFYYDWSLEWDSEENKVPVRKGNSRPFTGVGYLEAQELLNGFNK
jgi:hypothetical protein